MKFFITAILGNASIGAAVAAHHSGHPNLAGILAGLTVFFVWQVGKSAGREEAGGVP